MSCTRLYVYPTDFPDGHLIYKKEDTFKRNHFSSIYASVQIGNRTPILIMISMQTLDKPSGRYMLLLLVLYFDTFKLFSLMHKKLS